MACAVSRRQFFSILGAGAATAILPGCQGVERAGRSRSPIQVALQLYSLNQYIPDRTGADGRVVKGVGLERALDNIAAIGYRGVEFYGGHYFGHEPKEVRRMLVNSGLKACGIHVSCKDYGLDTKMWTYDSDVLKRTCEKNLAIGNNLIVCPGGGNLPPGCNWSTGRGGEPCPPSQAIDDHTRRLVDAYNRLAADAAKLGCRVGLHNHTWEHTVFMLDGTSFWDYFLSNTCQDVCMEQDVGWTTCAGVDPKVQYEKYPHRSPTLHAKENGMGKNVKQFDAILGQPGRPGATPVDWDGLIPVAERDCVQWFVVECERHFGDLSAVLPSFNFLRSKGLG